MPYPAIDTSQVRMPHLVERGGGEALAGLVFPEDAPPEATLPGLAEAAGAILARRQAHAPLVWFINHLAVQQGLAPLLVILMRQGFISHLACDLEASIQDYEIAMLGSTREKAGFDAAEEIGLELSQAISRGAVDGLGVGEALGRWLASKDEFPYRQYSLLYTAYQLGVPCTVNGAIGTNLIYTHPACDFAAWGRASGQDFKILAQAVAHMDGGIFCTFDPSYLSFETLRTASNLSRSLGYPDANPGLLQFTMEGRVDDAAGQHNPAGGKPPLSLLSEGWVHRLSGNYRSTMLGLFYLLQQQVSTGPASDLPASHRLEVDLQAALATRSPAIAEVLRRTWERDPILQPTEPALIQAFNLITRALDGGGTLFLCGNGGSFSDCLHIAGELLKSYKLARPIPQAYYQRLGKLPGGSLIVSHLQRGLRAYVLGSNPSLVSAIDNDVGERHMGFAQELYALARPGDALLGISTSGSSPNVCNAALVARALGMPVIALTGSTGGKLVKLSDAAIQAPGTDTAEVQSWHIRLYHALCEMLEIYLVQKDTV
jgi:D-sedoheptulose 7-phosphate isomerase